MPIIDRIIAKLANWKGFLLSIMGRVQLVNSIIHSMLLHSFHVYLWPFSLIKFLDKCIVNFIWAGDINVRKLSTVAWDKVCSPLQEGGLGIRSLKDLNHASVLKLCWDMIVSHKQWAQFLKARFIWIGNWCPNYIQSSLWSAFKCNIDAVQDNSR